MKYGLFSANSDGPLQTYEGDRMDQNKEFVYIFKKIPTNKEKQVAAIKLADGQSVKEIE